MTWLRVSNQQEEQRNIYFYSLNSVRQTLGNILEIKKRYCQIFKGNNPTRLFSPWIPLLRHLQLATNLHKKIKASLSLSIPRSSLAVLYRLVPCSVYQSVTSPGGQESCADTIVGGLDWCVFSRTQLLVGKIDVSTCGNTRWIPRLICVLRLRW